MLNLNMLLSLIFQCKKTGAGKLGNGRIYVKLMCIIADRENKDISAETDILRKFGNCTADPTAYTRMDKFLNRYIKTGKNYPFQVFKFKKFEMDYSKNLNYIAEMRSLCDEVLDEKKIRQLTYTLLEILRQDSSIETLIYGTQCVSKNELFGSYAHPKRICFDALLLGALYHTHKNHAESGNIELLNTPDRLKFHVVRFSNEKSLDLEMPIKLIENIRENAKRQESSEMKYRLEMRCGGSIISQLPEKGNIFLYGTGGAGKTTLLTNQENGDSSVDFYFPLYKYKQEIHENLQSESCQILLQILLKYHYQYEYQTYEMLIANEGENAVLQQLAELKNLLKLTPIDGFAKYTLLLDGINELPSESQEQLVDELNYIVSQWKNVRIIITGRTVPRYAVFGNFHKVEVCGVPDIERDKMLSEFSDISTNTRLLELLKTPLFLNMYLESGGTELNTRGEILDSYVMNIQSRLPQDSAVRFAVQYALPYAAKMMTDGFSYEIDRGDLSEAIGKAVELYLLNERVYQNYIAPKKYRKKALLESRENVDIVELLTDNVCFLTASKNEPHKFHFTHQYFRDYFAAKHILNLAEALSVSYEYKHTDERTELFKKNELDLMWFYDEDDIYRLIGEISGDYKNAPCEYFFYQRTILDSILDMSKYISTLHTAECVIKVMSLVRGNIICGVDFSNQDLYLKIPNGIRFSLDGEFPCRFCYSWIFFIEISDITATAVTSDGRYRLAAFENGYVIMWNFAENRLLWNYDLSRFTEDGRDFEYAIFSDDENIITLVSCNSVVNLEVTTGAVLSSKNQKGYAVLDEFFECTEKFPSPETEISDELKREIFSQMNHFKNCDFTGAEFFDDEGRELLGLMGAVVDAM
ncbi:MAG: hypothetical protein IJY19_07700 [Ruminococcus sp.]|nr:hypothetical protein [Ruminococcus sp.]